MQLILNIQCFIFGINYGLPGLWMKFRDWTTNERIQLPRIRRVRIAPAGSFRHDDERTKNQVKVEQQQEKKEEEEEEEEDEEEEE